MRIGMMAIIPFEFVIRLIAGLEFAKGAVRLPDRSRPCLPADIFAGF